jgi:hypothetical protein
MRNDEQRTMTIEHTYEGATYRWCLRREDIDRVLHYTHWIPNLKGFTRAFFAENYPGAMLSEFTAAFRAADIVLYDDLGAPFGGRCHWKLLHLYFTDDTHWAVEWDDTVTADDGRFFYTGNRDDDAFGSGAISVGVGELLGPDGEPTSDKVNDLLTRLGTSRPKK